MVKNLDDVKFDRIVLWYSGYWYREIVEPAGRSGSVEDISVAEIEEEVVVNGMKRVLDVEHEDYTRLS